MIHTDSSFESEFIKTFQTLLNHKSAWQIWSDFVEASAIAISQANFSEKREERYLQIIKSYERTDVQKVFSQLFAIMIQAFTENPNQDFLGQMFMKLELGSHWHGQFFTPYSVGEMMAEMSSFVFNERGFITVNDPACGAGCLLIAERNYLAKKGYGSNQTLFVGQDISNLSGFMAYIQLSLLGCAGFICIADTLRYPVQFIDNDVLRPTVEQGEIWFTPVYWSEDWQCRIASRKLERMLRDLKQLAKPKEHKEPVQLTLF